MRQNNTRSKNWMMRIASGLLVVTLVSLHMVSGLFARYTTEASGADGARVAKFSVTEALAGDSGSVFTSIGVGVVPDVPCKVEVTVTNDSEVAVTYEIDVDNATDNLPLKFYVVDSEDVGETDGKLSLAAIAAAAGVVPYSFDGTIQPNTAQGYSLYVVWTPADDADALENMGKVDMISLELSATQID